MSAKSIHKTEDTITLADEGGDEDKTTRDILLSNWLHIKRLRSPNCVNNSISPPDRNDHLAKATMVSEANHTVDEVTKSNRFKVMRNVVKKNTDSLHPRGKPIKGHPTEGSTKNHSSKNTLKGYKTEKINNTPFSRLGESLPKLLHFS